ncbi:uncharacterized protein MONBRDRAFT_26842 [Monosiga brevicollis MX1]|uniref:Rotatin N-terminal domain-containing protein n=1 Tax=Monosiga brevicollis TaxID=81824 RepID=A9V3P2_MONBE|nr:uncharacterized protein MONBRDRAFT_26842 [Monosiga brevicollis MX1]EDQ87847.1 predicted protein [Monosiga brevicollis MX1]|eukprot:XP_001747380.1 hypothetical protein [Monosiga brevicollis MX1]
MAATPVANATFAQSADAAQLPVPAPKAELYARLDRLIAQLSAPLLEDRVGALHSITFKLACGLLLVSDLVHKESLLKALLEWFNFEDVAEHSAVLNLILKLAEHPASAALLVDLGAVDFMRDLHDYDPNSLDNEVIEQISHALLLQPQQLRRHSSTSSGSPASQLLLPPNIRVTPATPRHASAPTTTAPQPVPPRSDLASSEHGIAREPPAAGSRRAPPSLGGTHIPPPRTHTTPAAHGTRSEGMQEDDHSLIRSLLVDDDLAILDLVIQRLSQVETLVQACQLIQDVLVLDFPPTLLLVYHPLMMRLHHQLQSVQHQPELVQPILQALSAILTQAGAAMIKSVDRAYFQIPVLPTEDVLVPLEASINLCLQLLSQSTAAVQGSALVLLRACCALLAWPGWPVPALASLAQPMLDQVTSTLGRACIGRASLTETAFQQHLGLLHHFAARVMLPRAELQPSPRSIINLQILYYHEIMRQLFPSTGAVLRQLLQRADDTVTHANLSQLDATHAALHAVHHTVDAGELQLPSTLQAAVPCLSSIGPETLRAFLALAIPRAVTAMSSEGVRGAWAAALTRVCRPQTQRIATVAREILATLWLRHAIGTAQFLRGLLACHTSELLDSVQEIAPLTPEMDSSTAPLWLLLLFHRAEPVAALAQRALVHVHALTSELDVRAELRRLAQPLSPETRASHHWRSAASNLSLERLQQLARIVEDPHLQMAQKAAALDIMRKHAQSSVPTADCQHVLLRSAEAALALGELAEARVDAAVLEPAIDIMVLLLRQGRIDAAEALVVDQQVLGAALCAGASLDLCQSFHAYVTARMLQLCGGRTPPNYLLNALHLNWTAASPDSATQEEEETLVFADAVAVSDAFWRAKHDVNEFCHLIAEPVTHWESDTVAVLRQTTEVLVYMDVAATMQTRLDELEDVFAHHGPLTDARLAAVLDHLAQLCALLPGLARPQGRAVATRLLDACLRCLQKSVDPGMAPQKADHTLCLAATRCLRHLQSAASLVPLADWGRLVPALEGCLAWVFMQSIGVPVEEAAVRDQPLRQVQQLALLCCHDVLALLHRHGAPHMQADLTCVNTFLDMLQALQQNRFVDLSLLTRALQVLAVFITHRAAVRMAPELLRRCIAHVVPVVNSFKRANASYVHFALVQACFRCLNEWAPALRQLWALHRPLDSAAAQSTELDDEPAVQGPSFFGEHWMWRDDIAWLLELLGHPLVDVQTEALRLLGQLQLDTAAARSLGRARLSIGQTELTPLEYILHCAVGASSPMVRIAGLESLELVGGQVFAPGTDVTVLEWLDRNNFWAHCSSLLGSGARLLDRVDELVPLVGLLVQVCRSQDPDEFLPRVRAANWLREAAVLFVDASRHAELGVQPGRSRSRSEFATTTSFEADTSARLGPDAPVLRSGWAHAGLTLIMQLVAFFHALRFELTAGPLVQLDAPFRQGLLHTARVLAQAAQQNECEWEGVSELPQHTTALTSEAEFDPGLEIVALAMSLDLGLQLAQHGNLDEDFVGQLAETAVDALQLCATSRVNVSLLLGICHVLAHERLHLSEATRARALEDVWALARRLWHATRALTNAMTGRAGDAERLRAAWLACLDALAALLARQPLPAMALIDHVGTATCWLRDMVSDRLDRENAAASTRTTNWPGLTVLLMVLARLVRGLHADTCAAPVGQQVMLDLLDALASLRGVVPWRQTSSWRAWLRLMAAVLAVAPRGERPAVVERYLQPLACCEPASLRSWCFAQGVVDYIKSLALPRAWRTHQTALAVACLACLTELAKHADSRTRLAQQRLLDAVLPGLQSRAPSAVHWTAAFFYNYCHQRGLESQASRVVVGLVRCARHLRQAASATAVAHSTTPPDLTLVDGALAILTRLYRTTLRSASLPADIDAYLHTLAA